MSEKKRWGSTVLGWFVVQDGAEASADAGEPPPAEAAPAEQPAAPPAPAFASEPPAARGGSVDFDGVFDAAGVGAEERALFAKAAGLLGSLPEGTDPATRKTI